MFEEELNELLRSEDIELEGDSPLWRVYKGGIFLGTIDAISTKGPFRFVTKGESDYECCETLYEAVESLLIALDDDPLFNEDFE